jgi:hypothetical protein
MEERKRRNTQWEQTYQTNCKLINRDTKKNEHWVGKKIRLNVCDRSTAQKWEKGVQLRVWKISSNFLRIVKEVDEWESLCWTAAELIEK